MSKNVLEIIEMGSKLLKKGVYNSLFGEGGEKNVKLHHEVWSKIVLWKSLKLNFVRAYFGNLITYTRISQTVLLHGFIQSFEVCLER